jgi:CrcB protein
MATADDGVPRMPFGPEIDLGSVRSGPTPRRRRARQIQAIIVVSLGIGGALGAVSRYALSLAVPTVTGGFPWSTFMINLSGSAVLGFVLVLIVEQFPRGRLARPVIGTGFIGAYTTFSTYMVDTVLLIRDGRPVLAAVYVIASALAGLLAVAMGMTAARVILRAERWLQEEVS